VNTNQIASQQNKVVAANLAGQGVIHVLAVAAGPIGWAVGGALTVATILLL
jgi:uncharacterized protein YaaW (UPF0174 family)